MKLLFLGDIVGKPGRLAVRHLLPKLIHRERADFVVANCENVSGGAGVPSLDQKKGVRFIFP